MLTEQSVWSPPSKILALAFFYFRRVAPAARRPFFDGSSIEYKRTLETRDPDEARQRYHPHARLRTEARLGETGAGK
jgi:hypothetical protein